jgi:hypothetical protein
MYTIFSWRLRVRVYYEIESGEITPEIELQVKNSSSEKQTINTQTRAYAVIQEQILIFSDYSQITDKELYTIVNIFAQHQLKDTLLSTVSAYECEKLDIYLSSSPWQERLRNIFVAEYNAIIEKEDAKSGSSRSKSGSSQLDMINRVWDTRDILNYRLKIYYGSQVDDSLCAKREVQAHFPDFDVIPFEENANRNAQKLWFFNYDILIESQKLDKVLFTRTRVYGE